jgi:hypothetical protein
MVGGPNHFDQFKMVSGTQMGCIFSKLIGKEEQKDPRR